MICSLYNHANYIIINNKNEYKEVWLVRLNRVNAK